MSIATYEGWIALVETLAAVVAAGVAIKLMDDDLDREDDRLAGKATVAAALGPGTGAYALAALAVAMLLDARVAGPLFLSAYAVGMAHAPGQRLPTGLAAWHESILAAGAGMLLAGVRPMMVSVAAMVFVQCADDLLDRAEDRRSARPSLITRLGPVETGLLGAAALLVGVSLAPGLMTAVIVAAVLVDGSCRRLGERLAGSPRFNGPAQPGIEPSSCLDSRFGHEHIGRERLSPGPGKRVGEGSG